MKNTAKQIKTAAADLVHTIGHLSDVTATADVEYHSGLAMDKIEQLKQLLARLESSVMAIEY